MNAPKKQNVLFVGHKANRSGAPIVLLEIIKAFKKETNIPIQILLTNGGELTRDFSLLGETFVWFKKPVNANAAQGVKFRITRILQVVRGFYILYKIRSSTLVFFNTIDNGHMHKKLLFLKCKFIYYVHELEAAIHMLTNKETLSTIINKTNLFLTVSEAVKNNLVNNYLVSETTVKMIATPFKSAGVNKNSYANFIANFRQVHRLAADAVVIGAVGQNEWRKGFDMFFPLVKLYFELFAESNVLFVWKGFNNKNVSSFFDLYKQDKYSLNGKIVILPHGNDSIETMACLDVHLLLSREDPYPLVTLEAAAFAIPTVCFKDGGGSPEFVEDDAGFCVDYGDLLQMAKRLHQLATDAELRGKMGEKAKHKLSRHSFERTIPDFVNVIKSQC